MNEQYNATYTTYNIYRHNVNTSVRLSFNFHRPSVLKRISFYVTSQGEGRDMYRGVEVRRAEGGKAIW